MLNFAMFRRYSQEEVTVGQINPQMLKDELFKYLDVDKLKALAGAVDDETWNPFELDSLTGKPVGFNKALIQHKEVFDDILAAGVFVVEKVCADLKEVAVGGVKRQALVDFLNSIIDIPWVPEGLEDNMIGFAVDKMIGLLNKLLGKNWLERIPTPSIVRMIA